jgi:hypothetical protein
VPRSRALVRMCAVRPLKPCRWCIAKPASLVHSLTGANNEWSRHSNWYSH